MDIEWSEHLVQALKEAGGTRVSGGLTISPAYIKKEGKEEPCSIGTSVKTQGASRERYDKVKDLTRPFKVKSIGERDKDTK